MNERVLARAITGLLIDDDSEDAARMINLLAKPDWPPVKFEFSRVETLKEGLDIVAREKLDIVVLDLMLPDSRGIASVLKVRAAAPQLPIVVLTGINDEALALIALNSGAQDYQVKGNISSRNLKRTISYAVERHRLRVGLHNIIEGAPDGMCIIDSKENVLFANAAAQALLKHTANQLLGKPLPYTVSQDHQGVQRLDIGDKERKIEIRFSEIEWLNEPARLASMRDIADLSRIEQMRAAVEQSQRMDKLKDELMSAVSHEIRSPLTIIKAATINLRDKSTGPLTETQLDMVTLQYRNVLRLEKIVNNVLDLSRLESGRAELAPRRVDLARLIRGTTPGFALVAKERGIVIKEEIPKDTPSVWADYDLTIQVLNNLIDNALRFTRSEIIIRIGFASENDPRNASVNCRSVIISVIDDGMGIPADRLGDLFNKFVQVQRKSRPDGYKGTGLGLALCKEILDCQGGKIWVESDAGHGARFHFALPEYDPALHGAGEPVAAQAAGGTSGGPR